MQLNYIISSFFLLIIVRLIRYKKVNKGRDVGCVNTEVTPKSGFLLLLVTRFSSTHMPCSEPATPTGPGQPWLATFLCSRKKTGKKGRVSKQKLLKSCHQGQNVTVLASLERLEFTYISCQPTMADNTFQGSMAPPLWNPFRWPCSSCITFWEKNPLLFFNLVTVSLLLT